MDRPASWRTVAIDLETERTFRVGGATIDPVSRDAKHAKGTERLQPQTLKVLLALAQRRGEVVTRSELIDCCWGGRIVGEDVINRSISILRDFADRAGGFRIETVPKAGYRIVDTSGSDSGFRKAVRWVLPVVLLLTLVAGVLLATNLRKPDGAPVLVALKPINSSDDRGARELAAATGDALSHMLVAGSFHGKLAWPATAKDEATADVVLSGDVRRTGDTFAVVVQVRDRRTRAVIFSRRYETPVRTANSLPEQIGAEISSNLTGVLALLVLDASHSENPEITAEKLKSIAITVSGDDPLGSYEISRRLAAAHPETLLAQLGLAYDTSFALGSLPKQQRPEAVRKARIAAQTALRIAPDFGDTYAPWCYLHSQTRARECEDRLRAGMKADPDAPFTPVFLNSLLFNVGRFEESSQVARKSLTGDPFHPHKLRRVVRALIVLGRKEEAEQVFSQAMRWWPKHEGLHWDHLYAYAIRGDLDGAEKVVRQLPPAILERPKAEILAMLSAYRAKDRARLHSMCLAPEAGYLLQSFCLTTLHNLADRAGALEIAERLFPRALGPTAAETEAMWLDQPDLGIEPMLSAPAAAWLRSEPRFLDLAERTGAIAYWRADRLPDFCRGQPEPVCPKLLRRLQNI